MVEVPLPLIICSYKFRLGDVETATSDEQQSDEISERVSMPS